MRPPRGAPTGVAPGTKQSILRPSDLAAKLSPMVARAWSQWWPQPQSGGLLVAPKAHKPNGCPDEEVFVRQQMPLMNWTEATSDAGRQRWESPNRRLAHTPARIPPQDDFVEGWLPWM